jgi:general secretion pathway protein L
MVGNSASFMARALICEVGLLTPRWFGVFFLGAPQTEQLFLSPKTKELSRTKAGLRGPLDLINVEAFAVPPVKTPPEAVIAELPPELCLARRIEAPARSAAQLEAVAALDLTRKTPFRQENVYSALSRPMKTTGGLVATQWIARRDDIARLERNLNSTGIALVGVRVQGQGTTPELLADFSGAAGKKGRWWRYANAVLLACALTATLVGWAYPAWLASQALPALEERYIAAEETALALRQEIEGLRQNAGEQTAFLAGLVQGPKLANSLRELTVALPDDTWVSDLTYSRDALSIVGETSASAADLVISLSDARTFANPRLSGPVSSTGGGERFEIVLDLRGGQ